MLGLVMDQPAAPLVQKMTEFGLLALCAGEQVVRFLPPLNVKDEEIEEAVDIVADCLAEIHGMPAAE
jgi:acetylornithine/succinyldiaminopimelate/putrescine aminotransferase